ncbi:PREDICTED: putative phosphatidylglycerol/phosphatidylinositol transfer protein DDB_G0278295 [Amphimedon queenslandica]|uniref:MD-2-related lipid-recognition domain-containing protein n=1 Tax=Amphimedon queenslandica TaxID=400682 RepID=A0A1X7UHC5_AMPQE|nr:PREDICTED: putative phosphatidylglycerol/phosphatidylinositol transfer protein DDB_G0278295 [Amphimedon queenslandica]|eukprot:XP_019854360.1 PREDICTED: putative phosphatidylglycerol/phosphatidylinositol transfer protein DDB_G0278295 [Amphimedon queenslandica]
MAVSGVYQVLSLLVLTKSAHPYDDVGKAELNDHEVFRDCSPSNKFFEVTNRKISPMPIMRGQDFHILAKIEIKEKIEWGILHLMVTYPLCSNMNVTIVDEKLNFCDFCDDALKLYCPIQPGTYYMNDTYQIPEIFWTGLY